MPLAVLRARSLIAFTAALAVSVAALAEERTSGAPDNVPALKNPIERTDASVNTGRRIWMQHCAVCHGVDGRGETEMLEFLATPPPDLTKGEWKYGSTDGAMFTVVRDGTEFDMDAFGDKLSDNNIWHVINFMRSIAPELEEDEDAPIDEPALSNPFEQNDASIRTGRRVWMQHCAVCHGIDGRGETEMLEFLATPPPDITKGEWKYGDTDPVFFKIIRDGTEFDMEAFGDKLNDNNIWHVINFMRSLAPSKEGEDAGVAEP